MAIFSQNTFTYSNPMKINSFMPAEIKKMIRAYVNTPATAKLAITECQKCDHSFRFSKGSQKTLKFILIR